MSYRLAAWIPFFADCIEWPEKYFPALFAREEDIRVLTEKVLGQFSQYRG